MMRTVVFEMYIQRSRYIQRSDYIKYIVQVQGNVSLKFRKDNLQFTGICMKGLHKTYKWN